jgi:hypothetical protein
MKDRQCGVDKVVLPYSHALHQASILKALDLRKQCVVGSLSTATHAITSANQAFEIMIDSKSSTVASGYRQIATEYFSQD